MPQSDGLIQFDVCGAESAKETRSEPGSEADHHHGDEWLALAGQIVGGVAAFEPSNLLPQSHVFDRKRARLVAAMTRTTGFATSALIVLLVSLTIGAHRYQRSNEGLEGRIATIQTEGDAVGVKLTQLQVVESARTTRNDLRNLITGLHAATPQGITYSHVDLDETGSIRLRGQAQSVALPFELPELLERQPTFTDVLLQDAGQSQRGAGTITEFRIDCRLSRQEEP
jgi:hypothetical protein